MTGVPNRSPKVTTGDPLDRIAALGVVEGEMWDYVPLPPEVRDALVEVARAARALLVDDDMPNHWDDCACSYCTRNRALRAAVARLDGET